MELDELHVIVTEHLQWLNSGGKAGRQANFESADLRQADLRGLNLSYAIFRDAKLERAELKAANLRSADLRRADISYANLEKTDLAGANLGYTIARGADLIEANLSGAILVAARFDYARLHSANLSNVLAQGAIFYQTDMSAARIHGTDVRDADFRYANLISASIKDARLDHARLKGALFTAEQSELLAASQGDQIGAEETSGELSLEERKSLAARRQMFTIIKYVQRFAAVISVVSVLVFFMFGAIDLYRLITNNSSTVSSEFNYFLSIILSIIGAVVATGAAFLRWRSIENAIQRRAKPN